MQRWQRKAVVDGFKAFLPFQDRLREVARALRPYSTNPENDIGLLSDSMLQIDALKRSGARIDGARIVEVGAGWKPILPMMYRLCGARSVVTLDQERLLDLRQFKAALAYIKSHWQEVGRGLDLQLTPDFSRITAEGDTLDDVLEASGIDYRAPYDFLNLPENSADIVVSRNVLEHIPEHVLTRIHTHCRDVVSPGGFICHTIDMSDHWEHQDKSISRVNFLQYEGLPWKLAGLNVQNYQNRLRQYEYLGLFERAFNVMTVTGKPDSAALRALPALKIVRRYADISHHELSVLTSTIVAQKRQDSGAAVNGPRIDPVAALS